MLCVWFYVNWVCFASSSASLDAELDALWCQKWCCVCVSVWWKPWTWWAFRGRSNTSPSNQRCEVSLASRRWSAGRPGKVFSFLPGTSLEFPDLSFAAVNFPFVSPDTHVSPAYFPRDVWSIIKVSTWEPSQKRHHCALKTKQTFTVLARPSCTLVCSCIRTHLKWCTLICDEDESVFLPLVRVQHQPTSGISTATQGHFRRKPKLLWWVDL